MTDGEISNLRVGDTLYRVRLNAIEDVVVLRVRRNDVTVQRESWGRVEVVPRSDFRRLNAEPTPARAWEDEELRASKRVASLGRTLAAARADLREAHRARKTLAKQRKGKR